MAQILLRLAMFLRIGTRFRPLHAKKAASLTLFTDIFQFVYLYSKIPVKIFRDTGNSIFRMLKGEIAEFKNIKSLKIYIRNYYPTKKSPLKAAFRTHCIWPDPDPLKSPLRIQIRIHFDFFPRIRIRIHLKH